MALKTSYDFMKRILLLILIYMPVIILLDLLFFNFTEKSIIYYVFQNNISVNKNIIKNGNFKTGLKDWSYDNGISVTNIDEKYYAHIIGNNKQQKKIWQKINVVSGEFYSIKFDLKGKQKGAFVIVFLHGKEKYFWCNGTDKEKHYDFKVQFNKTGQNCLYLSTNDSGDYYFSNISFKTIKSKNIPINYLLILILAIIIFELCIYLSANNKILVATILLISILPIVKINKAVKNLEENRNFISFKPLIHNHRINTNFGTDYNNWLNDRFLGRKHTINAFNLILSMLNNGFNNDRIINGHDRWLFFKENILSLANWKNNEKKYLDETITSIERFNNFCKTNNFKSYILIAPYAEELYSENLIGINLKSITNVIDKTITKINLYTDEKILYALRTMKLNKTNDYVHFKTDHHWSYYGAYVCYQDLMKELQITSLSNNCFNIAYDATVNFGSLLNYLKIDKRYSRYFFPSTHYRKYYYNYEKNITTQSKPVKSAKYASEEIGIVNNSKGNDIEIFSFGDSYVRNINFFLSRTFSKTTFHVKPEQIYLPDIEREIIEASPDIVIIVVYAQNFWRIKNWYNEKNNQLFNH